jgi:hypothetical protein
MDETCIVCSRPVSEESTIHPQVCISHGPFIADVDEGIADLILELWRAGIYTGLSCQDNPAGWVWIDIPIDCAELFLTVAATPFDDDVESICNRSVGRKAPRDYITYLNERAWQYAVQPWNYAADERDVTIGLDFSVRFPQCDYEEVLRRFRKHNAEEEVRAEIRRLWSNLPNSEPSPVKIIAKAMNLPNAEVASVIYPPVGVSPAQYRNNPEHDFTGWADSHEPEL